ncbi:hypothetical protein LCGC14_2968540, partial [marine sediment metagenome]
MAETDYIGPLLAQFQQQADEANAMNEQRYQEGMNLWNQIISQYQPGGGFGAGYESQIETAKTKDVAKGAQSLVSSGLMNTTTAAGLSKQWESDVGSQARLNLQDLRSTRLSEAMSGKAGFIERREDIPPDPSVMANLALGAMSGPGGGMIPSSYSAGGSATPAFPEEAPSTGSADYSAFQAQRKLDLAADE